MDDTAKRVAAGYDRLAARYGSWADAVTPPLRERYAQYLIGRVADGASVLEVGCGPGVPVLALLANHFNVTGVDVSQEMVSRARTAVPEANFLAADIRDVRFERGSFDAVIALYSLIHVPRSDHQELLSRVHAWLVDDGVLVANFGARDLPEGRDPDWLGSGEMTWSFFDAATNLRLLDETGFEIEQAQVISQVEPGGADVEFLWTVARKRARHFS